MGDCTVHNNDFGSCKNQFLFLEHSVEIQLFSHFWNEREWRMTGRASTQPWCEATQKERLNLFLHISSSIVHLNRWRWRQLDQNTDLNGRAPGTY
jgi:hypothetical protein